MNTASVIALKALKRAHSKVFGQTLPGRPDCIRDPELASGRILALLGGNQPAMIARFGSTELSCLANYLGVKHGGKAWLGYIQGKSQPWWWNRSIIEQMQCWSGVFPANVQTAERFCELMLQDIPEVDLLGSWLPEEKLVDGVLEGAVKVDLELLNPYFSRIPWTRALEGKRVLVIHPFVSTMKAQYTRRELLFKDNLLPAFDLVTIKAVQSIAGEQTEFPDWFTALEHMKSEMDRLEYDICLIGCGAYGFPLAAHAKRRGKVGFHLGGSLQLLFGIRGKRWENASYNPDFDFSRLMNAYWVKPSEEERPKAADKVEGACYW